MRQGPQIIMLPVLVHSLVIIVILEMPKIIRINFKMVSGKQLSSRRMREREK